MFLSESQDYFTVFLHSNLETCLAESVCLNQLPHCHDLTLTVFQCCGVSHLKNVATSTHTPKDPQSRLPGKVVKHPSDWAWLIVLLPLHLNLSVFLFPHVSPSFSLSISHPLSCGVGRWKLQMSFLICFKFDVKVSNYAVLLFLG